jgi:hypothetical protein
MDDIRITTTVWAAILALVLLVSSFGARAQDDGNLELQLAANCNAAAVEREAGGAQWYVDAPLSRRPVLSAQPAAPFLAAVRRGRG